MTRPGLGAERRYEGVSVQRAGAAAIRRSGRLSVYELFAAQAKRNPDALAIEQGSLRRSYGALDERVRRLAAALHGKGIRYGDRVALVSENRAEYIEIDLAAACLGAIVACQNWRLAAAEMQPCLDLVSPALVIVSRRFAKMLSTLGSARCRKLHHRGSLRGPVRRPPRRRGNLPMSSRRTGWSFFTPVAPPACRRAH